MKKEEAVTILRMTAEESIFNGKIKTIAQKRLNEAMSRQTLWAVAHNQPVGGRGDLTTLPTPVSDLIKKSYFLLENMWETYMLEIRPTSKYTGRVATQLFGMEHPLLST